MSGHTPGPWEWIRVVGPSRKGRSGPFKHALIGFVDAETPLARCNSNEADTRLIAASPESHAANVQAEIVLSILLANGQCTGNDQIATKALAACRAAIAKVRGEG